jgi:ribosome biogenesis GTPase
MSRSDLTLEQLGLDARLKAAFEASNATAGQFPARVIREDRGEYRILGDRGERRARVTGRFRNEVSERQEYPAVGDWVVASFRKNDSVAEISAVLPRKSAFARKGVMEADYQQVVAANIDTVFLVSGLDLEFNIRRIERYLTLGIESGATPVIVLNKLDVGQDAEEKIEQVRANAPGIAVIAVSAETGHGLDALSAFVEQGQTAAVLGSSGVGKSSLINALFGYQRLKTANIRAEDGKGRHTTTRRELFLLPNGGLVIDTPGMRELQLWADEEDLKATFEDVTTASLGCRFRDCRHNQEPDCAVRAAVEAGELSSQRVESWRKQRLELDALFERQLRRQREVEHGRWVKSRKLKKEQKNVHEDYTPEKDEPDE